MHESQSLGVDLGGEKIDTSRIAARVGEAGDEAERYRVLGHAEYDRDRCRCGLGGERGGIAAGRGDHGNVAPHQVVQQRRQAFVMAIHPMVLDRNILAFDVARFAQPLAECRKPCRLDVGHPAVDEGNQRQRRLLRARRQWPCRRGAEQRYDLAPPHSTTRLASASRFGGTSSPSAFAVLRLRTSSNFVGCMIGRSAGLAPFNILSTSTAANSKTSW